MHAYLIIGPNSEDNKKKSKEISDTHSSMLLPHQLKSIDDVRSINKLLKTKVAQPTSIFIENIQLASIAAMNSFLKCLEEPQDDVNFIITADHEENVIQTIVSRAQPVNMMSVYKPHANKKDLADFIEGDLKTRFDFLQNIKKRDQAIDFLSDLEWAYHKKFNIKNIDKKNAKNILHIYKSKDAMRKNGNVFTHLTNLVLHLV